MENNCTLEWLDLDLRYTKAKCTLDHKKFWCKVEEKEDKFLHLLHSDNIQLNSLVDLSFVLLQNLKNIDDKYSRKFQLVNTQLEKKNDSLKRISNNLEYIKENMYLEHIRKLATANQIEKLNKTLEKIEKQQKEIFEYLKKL